MKPKTYNSNKIEYDIVKNLLTMNHFESWYYIKRPISLHWTILFCIPNTSYSNHKCKVLIMLQLGLHIEEDGLHTPCSHAVMLRSWKVWLEASLTNVGLRTLGVYCKSSWNLSHSKFACLLAVAIAFCSLRWNLIKRLFKTHTFMVAWWSWCLKPFFQVDGHLGVLGSMVTLWCACKCHTKLYLAI
jgi:hypothetical protein